MRGASIGYFVFPYSTGEYRGTKVSDFSDRARIVKRSRQQHVLWLDVTMYNSLTECKWS